MSADFLDAKYWTSFYDDDDEQFDWYSAPGLTYAAVLREVVARRADGVTTILDVGCGTAGHLSALARCREAVVMGIDFSPRVVRREPTP